MKTQLFLLEPSSARNQLRKRSDPLRSCMLLIVAGIISNLGGCASPQNCQPYPNYPSYPGYPTAYNLPSGTTVPTVGAPPVGSTIAQPPVIGQPIPGSVPAYPTLAPGQPVPPGYTMGPR